MALSIVIQERACLIVLDWLFRRPSSQGLYDALRAHPQTHHIPILISADDIEPFPLAEEVRAQGNDVLMEPFDIDAFAAAVRRLSGPSA
jgi:PleD family two-component response regulator